MFLTLCSPMSSKAYGSLSRILSRTVREMQMPPGSASASSRAAILTPSPRVARHIGGEDRGETAFDRLFHLPPQLCYRSTTGARLRAICRLTVVGTEADCCRLWRSARHRDPTPSPVGRREVRMGCGGPGDAFAHAGQPGDDPAGGEIDVQIHQLLGGGALAAGEAEHLVRQVQALAVAPKDLRRDLHPLADQQLALIEIVRLRDKGAVVGGALIFAADADGLEQRV